MDNNDEGEPGMTNKARLIANIREYFPPADIEGAIQLIETHYQNSGLPPPPPPPPPPPVPRVESFRETSRRQHYANLQEEIDNEAHGNNADHRPPPRTELVNSETPVTFKLDWNYCEKARGISANPVAEEGVTTLMGPPSARFEEEFDNSDDDDDSEEKLHPASIIIISVAKLLRRSQKNYEVQIIPDDEYIKSEMQDKEENSEKIGRIRNDTNNKRMKTEHTRTKLTQKEETNILEQREVEFLKTNDDDVAVLVRDAETKEVVAVYTTPGSTNNTPWLVIRCENNETTSHMMKLFNGGDAKNYYDTNDNDQYFILRTITHQEKYLSWKEVVPIQSLEEKKRIDTESYRLEMVTGISPSIFSKRGDTNNTTSWLHPTTMFKLFFIKKISSDSSVTRTDKDEKNEEDEDGGVGGDEIHKILVGKCLFSYQLASTEECGPTIEMI